MSENTVRLDGRLPLTVPRDDSTPLVLTGTLCGPQPARGVTLVIGDDRVPALRLTARIDVTGGLGQGFECLARLPGSHVPAISLAVDWARRGTVSYPIQTRATPDRTRGRTALPARIAICMATYNPPADLIEQQVRSLKGQSLTDWICLVQDDCSNDQAYAGLLAAVAGDPRFQIRRNSTNVGFYRNFENALARVPAEVEYVALADQDDLWYSHKLQTLADALDEHPEVWLVYHDVHVADDLGRMLASTFVAGHSSHRDYLAAVLGANTVTGWTSMFRTALLDKALPLPGAGDLAYHDHWLACCAVSQGPIKYIAEPLGRYVQHGGNVVGLRKHGARFWASHVAALAVAPGVPWIASSQRARKRYTRQLGVMLNSAPREYLDRTVFARSLALRGMADTSGDYPLRGRARWLSVALAAGPRSGTNAAAVHMRLLAAEVTQRAFRGKGAADLSRIRGPI